jgi:hypothetical protein
MNLTIEMVTFFLGLLGAIFTGISFVLKRIDNLMRKMEELQKSVSVIRENYVKHDVCRERRYNCSCVRELGELKQDLKNIRDLL